MTTTTFRLRSSDRFAPSRSGLARTVDTVQLWYGRARQRRHLEALGHAELEDVGISRIAALQEARKFFWQA